MTSEPAGLVSTPARPQRWLPAVAALAWIGLAAHAAIRHSHGSPFWTALALWTAMVVAMMLPFATKEAGWLASRSLRRRRRRAVATFAAAYLAPWLVVGFVAVAALAPVRGELIGAAAALALAAAWQVTPARRRVLRKCGTTRAPAARGRRAALDWLRSGMVAGGRCVATCWAVMLPMAIVHHPALMAGTMLVVASERRDGPNPELRAGRLLEASWIAASALAIAAVALIAR